MNSRDHYYWNFKIILFKWIGLYIKDFATSSREADTFWLSQLVALNTQATIERFKSEKSKDILMDTLLISLFKK